MLQGKIIAFEGIDGSGKGTQSKLLYNYYETKNIPSILIEFPGYAKTFFGKVVGEFLNGDFGNIDQVHPKLAAVLYAGDRFEQAKEIENYLTQGYIVICDRYVPSNIAHQIAKIPMEEQQKLMQWIEKLEYQIFKLPKPDIVLFMNMKPEQSSELVLKKDKRIYTEKEKDIHEEDESYLNKVYEAFEKLSIKSNWESIDCDNKSIELIHNNIIKFLEKKGSQR